MRVEGRDSVADALDFTMACMHCAAAPCIEVCPTLATYKRADGIVEVDYSVCIGCGYCVVACPYHARVVSGFDADWAIRKEREDARALRSAADREGVCTKCDFCRPIIEEGIAKGLTPGVDREATPLCVRACIADALHFGDLKEPGSPISQKLAGSRGFRLNERLGTDPSVYYFLARPLPDSVVKPGVEIIPPLRQMVWKWPALLNFFFGGLGAGLYLFATLSGAFFSIDIMTGSIAALLVLVGFLGLGWKSKHPGRSLFALRNLRNSWMSREILAGSSFIGLAVLDVMFEHTMLRAGAFGAAGLFLWSQGMMVVRAKAIPAWNGFWVPGVFVASGLAGGGAIALLLGEWGLAAPSATHAGALLGIVLFSAVFWGMYLRSLRESGPAAKESLKIFRAAPNAVVVLVVGHLLPLTLLATWLLVPAGDEAAALGVLAALLIIVGTAVQKALIFLRSGILHSVDLEVTNGSGLETRGW